MRGSRTATREREAKRKDLESSPADGDRPVRASFTDASSILSSAEHEEFCVNQPGPSGKAKYSRETDSERVP